MNKLQSHQEKVLEEFDKKFYGRVDCVDDTGGYDAKPYLKNFIAKALSTQREIMGEFVLEEVIGGDENTMVPCEIPDCPTGDGDHDHPKALPKVRNELRAEQRQKLESLKGEK